MSTKILYHDKCPDGFTAAWAAWRRFGADAEYIPVSYGYTPYEGTTDQDDVYLLDFCYPADVLRTLPARKLVILDHHKTAQADLELFKGKPEDEVIFDMERSGAGIAWDYFHMEPRPEIINYAEDHDLWRYKLRASREIRALFMATPYTFLDWSGLQALLFHDWDAAVDQGEVVMGFMEQQVKMIVDKSYFQSIGGVDVPVVNATTLYSEVGEALYKKYPEYPFVGYWFRRADSKIHWGLRTARPDVDVSEVAKKYGGGGHKAAAGFVTEDYNV